MSLYVSNINLSYKFSLKKKNNNTKNVKIIEKAIFFLISKFIKNNKLKIIVDRITEDLSPEIIIPSKIISTINAANFLSKLFLNIKYNIKGSSLSK
jgi:hypothetical protein